MPPSPDLEMKAALAARAILKFSAWCAKHKVKLTDEYGDTLDEKRVAQLVWEFVDEEATGGGA